MNNGTFSNVSSISCLVYLMAFAEALLVCSSISIFSAYSASILRCNWSKIISFYPPRPLNPLGCMESSSWLLEANFDGSSRGNLGPIGLGGGIVRDSQCGIILNYVGPLGVVGSNKVEIGALREGLSILRNLNPPSCICEGDTVATISWANAGSGPYHLVRWVNDVLDLKETISLSFVYANRERNSEAGRLARLGSSLPSLSFSQHL